MDEEVERLVIAVRADTSAFAQDVRAMRAELDGPLGASADHAGRAIEHALGRAVRSGKVGFEDLKRYALGAMAEIATASLRGAIGGGGGLGRVATSLVGGLLGLPGRATGGPVAPGRAYMVGERGPEMFVPTASGRVEASAGGAREVRVSISVNAAQGSEPRALAQSSRQVAREVKRVLMRVD